MKYFVLINSGNKFPRMREILEDKKVISFPFTEREGKEFTNKLDETEIFEYNRDDPQVKKEFYPLLFKTTFNIYSF